MRVLPQESGLNSEFWGEEIKHLAYLCNQSATLQLNSMEAVEKIFGRDLNNSNLRILALHVRINHKETWNSKFGDRLIKEKYVGITNGFYCIYVHTWTIFETSQFKINEHELPYKSSNRKQWEINTDSTDTAETGYSNSVIIFDRTYDKYNQALASSR